MHATAQIPAGDGTDGPRAEEHERRDLDPLAALEAWIAAQARDDAERRSSVAIETLDDGWSVMISLDGTELEPRRFTGVECHRDEHHWMLAWRDTHDFRAFCGACALGLVVQTFLGWASEPGGGRAPHAGAARARVSSHRRP